MYMFSAEAIYDSVDHNIIGLRYAINTNMPAGVRITLDRRRLRMFILARTSLIEWHRRLYIYRLINFLDLWENVLFNIDPSYIRTVNYTREIAQCIYNTFRMGVDEWIFHANTWTFEVWPPQNETSSSDSDETDNGSSSGNDSSSNVSQYLFNVD